jgi:hypothetical protein
MSAGPTPGPGDPGDPGRRDGGPPPRWPAPPPAPRPPYRPRPRRTALRTLAIVVVSVLAACGVMFIALTVFLVITLNSLGSNK